MKSNPIFNAGAKTTAQMIKFAVVDRLASKKRINENVVDVRGAPNTMYVRQL
jgi:hypothetical protein